MEGAQAQQPPAGGQQPAQPATAPQAPDLSKFPDNKDKVKAWLAYCESLRINPTGVRGNFPLLQAAALKGVDLAPASDAEDRSRFLFYVAFACYYQVKFDSAQHFFYQSLEEARRAGSAPYMVNACVPLISVNFQLQQPEKTDSIKNLLQSIMDTTHNKDILEDGDYALGNYYYGKAYYTTAQDYFLKGIELRRAYVDTTHSTKKQLDYAIQCYTLCKIYQNLELYDKGLAALRDGSRFMNASPVVAIRYLSAFNEVYGLSGNIDSALYYNTELAERTKNSPTIPSETVSANMNIALYYMKHRQYEKALPYVTRADSLATLSKSPIPLYQSEMTQGQYLEETGKYAAAITQLKLSLPVAQKINKEQYGDVLKFLALSEKGLGDNAAGMAYYETYVGVLDTLTREKISNNFADRETKFETKEKEQRIVYLNGENNLRALQLKSAAQERIFLIVGLIALGIICLLLYLIYRNKERLSNELSIANETKARLFSIIGHDLRSPVSKIVQLLRLQKERPDLLDEAARQRHEERLKTASENVLGTMEDLLLWSKSQMKHFTPAFHPIRVLPFIQKEIALLGQDVEDKKLEVVTEIPGSFFLDSDENFLSVIMRNLLQNAVKYSDVGSMITVRAVDRQIHVVNQSGGAGVHGAGGVPITAAALNERLKDSRVNSSDSGLGLQIAGYLAHSIHATLYFEQLGEHSLAAILSWEK